MSPLSYKVTLNNKCTSQKFWDTKGERLGEDSQMQNMLVFAEPNV